MYKIYTPATSANLSCGFDVFGQSISLYNTFTLRPYKNVFIFNGKVQDTDNSSNLIINSVKTGLEYLGEDIKKYGAKIVLKTKIPPSRGLGSSASCIVGGLTIAYLLSGREIDKDVIFNLASKLEGHPDNVAPLVYGGTTLSYKERDIFKYYKIDAHKKYKLCGFIPNFKLATKTARAALPQSYKKEDIVFNLARCALLPLALRDGNSEYLSDALNDRIHEPYRKTLIEGYDEIMDIANKCGFVGIYLSGAGPTIMGIYDEKADIKKAKKLTEEMNGLYEMKLLDIDTKGLIVEKSV